MNWNEKLTKLRAGRPYRSIAEAVSTTGTTIRNLESGEMKKPGVFLLNKICKFYGVTLDWLLDDRKSWPPTKSEPEEQAVDLVREALKAAKTNSLDTEDKKVLAFYRKLPNEDKRYLLGILQGMASKA
jgi:transcriptional regulator with XRE-family HTH domain